jgi:WD40 repeat protein
MEVGLAIGIAGLFGSVEQVISQLHTRFKNYKDNEGRVNDLSSCCTRIRENLNTLTEHLDPGRRRLPEDTVVALASHVTEMTAFFEKADKTLGKLAGNVATRVKRIRHASRVADSFKDLFADASSHGNTLITLITVLGAAQGSAIPAADVYSSRFCVPENPAGVILNVASPATLEGRIKVAVLGKSSKRVRAVASTGGGGVGKTCALKEVGCDPDVARHFTGGVYYMSLGQDAKPDDVVSQVASIVKASGGIKRDAEVLASATVSQAAREASSWFEGRRCLFICDDLWATKTSKTGFFDDLYLLISAQQPSAAQQESCMLFSTRDRDIGDLAPPAGRVSFSAREPRGEDAVAMLCSHAEQDSDALLRGFDDASVEAFEYVLDQCAGLPFALAVAGRAIAKSASRVSMQTAAGSVRDFERKLRDLTTAPLLDSDLSSSSGVYPTLNTVLSTSLRAAVEWSGITAADGRTTVDQMYVALSVMQKQAWAPLPMLRRLWGLPSDSDAAKIIDLLAAQSLVNEEIRDGVVGIKLHDLALDFCIKQVEQHGGAGAWHRRLVDGYKADILVVPSQHDSKDLLSGASVPWWTEVLVDDGYVHANLARHLIGCGVEGEKDLTTVLLDFRWTERQLSVNGLLSLKADFVLLRPSLWGNRGVAGSTDGVTVDDAGISRGLRLIYAAVQLAWGNAHMNPRELAFQLHGRLVRRRSDMATVDKFLASVERHAKRPCLWSIDPFLAPPGGPLIASYGVGFIVKCVVPISRSALVVVAGNGGNLVIVDTAAGRVVQTFQGHEGDVNAVAVDAGGSRIASGGRDGTVRVWHAETGTAVGDPVRCHNGTVYSIALCADGSRIVSGGGDCTVRVWDAASGAALVDPLRGHEGWVHSVAFNADGSRIVSGSRDGTVRVWRAEHGSASSTVLRGHDGWVRSVAFSADGSRIASGGVDCTVRMWDTISGAAMGEAVRGHKGWVRSVAFNADGSRIVSGGRDRTVRVWDVASGVAVGEALRGHEGWVRSVAFSADESRIVSGGVDCTVRVWDVASGNLAREQLRGHRGWVRSMALSADGSRIASGGDDCTVRVWDAESGLAVGEPLRGHEDWVNSVALSADGSRIVSCGSDGSVRVWDASNGATVGAPLRGHEGSVDTVALRADGSRIVSGGRDRTVRVWDAASGVAVGEPLRGHEGWVRSVAFNADGSRIVSGGRDRTVRVWDAASGTAVGEPLRGHAGWVRSVAFSADGSRIVSGSVDGTVRVWDAESGECVCSIDKGVSGSKDQDALLPAVASSAAQRPAASLRSKVSVAQDAILLTSQEGGGATRVGTLDSPIEFDRWVFDQSRRVLWIGLRKGGPVRIALVE